MADFADVPALIIAENGGQDRQIELRGRALPYRPLEFTVSQRVTVNWLPGTPAGTATLLGPVEKPTTIHGVWKRKFINVVSGLDATGAATAPPASFDGTQQIFFADLVPLFDELLRQGVELEVTWGPEIRFGFLKDFRRRYTTRYDVEWEMTFEWVSRAENAGNPVLADQQNLSDLSASAQGLIAGLDELEAPNGFGLLGELLNDLQQLQNAVSNGLLTAIDAILQFTSKVTSFTQASRGLLSTLGALSEAAQDIVSLMENSFGQEQSALLPPEAAVNGDQSGGGISGISYADQTEAQKLNVRIFKQEVKVWAQGVKVFATQQKAVVEAKLAGQVQAIVTAGATTSLYDIAAAYYGTPFEWRRLLIFNELDSPDLAPGVIVFIPFVNPEEVGQNCPGL